MPARALLCVALALVAAGCLAPPSIQQASTSAPASAFDVRMSGCAEGGGVSLYNADEGTTWPVEPFRSADTRDDVGDPPFRPGAMAPGATTGIWHVSLSCESYTYKGQERGPLQAGWVGVKILPPEWDTSGIQRQFFVADLSFMDEEIVKDLRALAHVHASITWGAKLEWPAPGVLHAVLDDEDHGLFQTDAKMRSYRAYEPQPTRFWMLVANGGHESHGEAHDAEGTTYRAISFDLFTTGGSEHLVAEGTAALSHTRTQAHGAVPGAAGPVAALLYTGFDREITVGPSPDLVFDQTWKH